MKWKTRLLAALLAAFVTAGSATAALAVNDTNTSQTTTQTTDTAGAKNSEKTATSSPEAAQAAMPTIDVDAEASLLVSGETGTILHADNEKAKMYPASCTKILTALVVLEDETTNLNDIVTISDEDLADVINGASNAGLKTGEQISVENLLYCLLLPSGNEAANALARYNGGSVHAFVAKMNAKAAELGCVNSHFVNPNGLHDDEHYTCAYDLYLIAREAMQNETFAEISNTAQKKLPSTNRNPERIIYTTNELILSSYSSIYYEYCYGIKTGHTSQAGYCLVSYAKKGDYTYYSVVLGCPMGDGYAGSFTATRELFEWAFDSFKKKTVAKAGDTITESPVRLGKGKDSITLTAAEDVNVLIPAEAQVSDVTQELSVQESYNAPITRGDVMGSVTYSYNGIKCATADLIALTDVERSQILYFFDRIGAFFSTSVFRIIFAVIIALALLYALLNAIAQRNKRRRRARRNKRRRR